MAQKKKTLKEAQGERQKIKGGGVVKKELKVKEREKLDRDQNEGG